MKNNTPLQGAYFMANNQVIDMAVAFLNSFRLYNKELPLCLIPIDDEYFEIEKLMYIYNFSIFTKNEILKKCDTISVKFHGNIVGEYRKLAAWEGDYEQFIYIDIYSVVLDDLSFIWANLIHCKIFTSSSNVPHERKNVWKDSIYIKNILNRSQILYSTNTSFLVSSKKTLPMNWVLDQVNKALELKGDMELSSKERPFLNFLIVTSGYNYGSLLWFSITKINKGRGRVVKFEFWAGKSGAVVKKGRLTDFGQYPLFLVNWTGILGQNETDISKIPYKNLWDYYRNLDPFKLPEPDYKIKLNTLQQIFKLYKNFKLRD